MKSLYDHLCRYDADAWIETVDLLAPNVADVDRDPVDVGLEPGRDVRFVDPVDRHRR